jgi:hypothetical protein
VLKPALVLAVIAVAAGPVAFAESAHPASAGSAVVTVSATATAQRLPPSFFGLSMEYSELPAFESNLPLFEHVLGLVHLQNDGPLVIRIGGDSADVTFWNPGNRHLPGDAFVLTPAWFTRASKLITDLGLHVILDLNLHGSSPAAEATKAKAALARLPSHSVIGFEIGNEPDLYGHGYSIADYVAAFRSYAKALRPVIGKLPLLGPASTSTTSVDVPWMRAVLADDRPQLGLMTAHRYPLAVCSEKTSPNYPTIPKLLSETTTAGFAQSVRHVAGLARAAGRPFRLDEFNSVTCGGLAGVSNTFATALWAPDALFELLGTGAEGVNMHIRSTKVNGPFEITPSGLEPRPLLYGLILFQRTIGAGGRPVKLRLQGPAHFKAWAV